MHMWHKGFDQTGLVDFFKVAVFMFKYQYIYFLFHVGLDFYNFKMQLNCVK